MSLLTVVQSVCATVGITVPISAFAALNANRTMQEMTDLASEMAQRIGYDMREWTTMRAFTTIVGDNITSAFDLPPNFKRMLLTSNVWRSTDAQAPMRFVSDPDEWLRRRLNNETDSRGEWTMAGGQIHIQPVLSIGQTAQFAFLDRNVVKLAGGGFGDKFQNDGDSFRLDERLLKLGMIWQWKANKGAPYAEDMGTYGDAMANDSGADSPAPIIIGRLPVSFNARTAYPWPVPS